MSSNAPQAREGDNNERPRKAKRSGKPRTRPRDKARRPSQRREAKKG